MSQGDNGVETHSPSIWGDISPLCRHFLKYRAWVKEILPSFSLQVSSVYINTASKVKRQGPLWLRGRAAWPRCSDSSLAPQTGNLKRQMGALRDCVSDLLSGPKTTYRSIKKKRLLDRKRTKILEEIQRLRLLSLCLHKDLQMKIVCFLTLWPK